MKRVIKIGVMSCLSVVLLLIGCAPRLFTYENTRYQSKNEALNAIKQDLGNITSSITPTNSPKFGSALVIIPSYKACVSRAILKPYYGTPHADTIDYQAESSMAFYHFMANILKKSNLFKEVTVEEALYPEVLAQEKRQFYDAVVYLWLPSPSQATWFLITTDSEKKFSLLYDVWAKKVQRSRVEFWLRDIEKSMNTKLGGRRIQEETETITKQTSIPPFSPIKQHMLVRYDPFAQSDMYDLEFGKDITIGIFDFSDSRAGYEGIHTMIGTSYSVAHIPIYRFYSYEPVGLALMRALETLFKTNGFRVDEYHQHSKYSNFTFDVRGKIKKFQITAWMSIKAEVEIDLEISDRKLGQNIWNGTIKGFKQLDLPENTNWYPIASTLNQVLAEAINNAWKEQGIQESLALAVKAHFSKTQELKISKELVHKTPKDSMAYFRMGTAFYAEEKFGGAIKAFNEALQLKPDWARARYHLGLSYLMKGDNNAALQQYEILKKLDKNFAALLFNKIYKN